MERQCLLDPPCPGRLPQRRCRSIICRLHRKQLSCLRALICRLPCTPGARSTGSKEKRGISFLIKGATVAGVGLGLANQRNSIIHCDDLKRSKTPPFVYPEDRGPPPTSSVSLYELGFGTVAGICAGVFVKKGAKAVAWFLGGIFVLLQDPLTGESRPPNVTSLWSWLVDFLTADFQPRASFIAGFALGLRLG
ncbi:hypothetical protein BJ912DRAFT_1019555 [Pholiota molesta]|nr:hypothetical protein BJ912DRAFT_1019555 [Pholiota molesta]